jgi:hypothetical protein
VPGNAVLETAEVTPEACDACAALGQPATSRIDSPPGVAVWTAEVPIEHTELGKKVWTATLQVPPGEAASFRIGYRVPDVVHTEGSRSNYRLVVQHQPKVHAETLRVAVELPEGASKVRAPGFKRSGGTLIWEHPLQRDAVLKISWAAAT